MSKTRLRASALIVLTALTLAAGAAAPTRAASDRWAPPPEGARAGAFKALQLSTTNPNALTAAWRSPTPGVRVQRVQRARLGQGLTTFIVFSGCTPDRQGKCDVEAAWRLIDPQGRPGPKSRSKVWTGEGVMPGGIYLSHDSLTLTFARRDPTGVYRLQAAITDRVSGVTLKTEQKLTIVE